MAEKTGISWADNTFNPWWGCRKVSPACRFCYAAATDKRWGGEHWGATTSRRMMADAYWRKPLRWNRDAAAEGRTLRVFAASMADVFEDHPDVIGARARLWDLIEQTPALTWMLLTKRPENVAGMVPWGDSWPSNVWLGTSAETQRFADQRIPILLDQPAAVRFVSAAPLLGPLNLYQWMQRDDPDGECATCGTEGWTGRGGHEKAHYCVDGACTTAGGPDCPMAGEETGEWCPGPIKPYGRIDWVITEGESGAKARPTHPAWFRSLRDQCETDGVVFHHKQNGEYVWEEPDDRRRPAAWVCAETGKTVRTEADVPGAGSWQAVWKVGLREAGRVLDGKLHDGHPVPAEVTR